MSNSNATYDRDTDTNRDPLTGAPGSHPIGTGVGAVLGGNFPPGVEDLAWFRAVRLEQRQQLVDGSLAFLPELFRSFVQHGFVRRITASLPNQRRIRKVWIFRRFRLA